MRAQVWWGSSTEIPASLRSDKSSQRHRVIQARVGHRPDLEMRPKQPANSRCSSVIASIFRSLIPSSMHTHSELQNRRPAGGKIMHTYKWFSLDNLGLGPSQSLPRAFTPPTVKDLAEPRATIFLELHVVARHCHCQQQQSDPTAPKKLMPRYLICGSHPS